MALDYTVEYPGQIVTSDPNYPHGKARNQLVLNDGTGTPWEERLVNDWFGLQQAILLRANIEPSGVPDSATVSQVLLSLLVVVHQEHGLLNWEKILGNGDDGDFTDDDDNSVEMRGGGYDAAYGAWLLAGDTDGCNISWDDGRHFTPLGNGMESNVGLEDLALAGQASNHSAVAVAGNSSTAYRRDDIGDGTEPWSTVTITGAVGLYAIVFDATNDRYITVGVKAGPDPFCAISDDPTGAAWSDVSANLPASFAGKTLESLATSAGVVVASASTAHTKLAVSTDGGATWADSTTDLASGIYAVTHSYNLGKFIAVRTGTSGTDNVYTSTDGDTWTLQYSGSLGLTESVGADQTGKSIAAYGRALVVAGKIEGGSGGGSGMGAIAYSTDEGATWRTQRVALGPLAALIADPLALRVLAPGENGGVAPPRIRGL